MALTKTQKRDIRDNTSLAISMAGLGVSIASLILTLNRKPDDEDEGEIVYSEKLGRVRRRC